MVQALLLSLATTHRIEFSFFSCRYLDVSVPYVPLTYTTLLMYGLVSFFPNQSFLIRISVNIMDICSSSQLFAAYHVLHRLLVPRHSPCALSSLTLSFITTFFSQSVNPKTFTSFSSLPYFSSIYFSMCLILYIIVYRLVGSNGIEPSTSRLSGVRSNHLSYEPIYQSFNQCLLLFLMSFTLFLMY